MKMQKYGVLDEFAWNKGNLECFWFSASWEAIGSKIVLGTLDFSWIHFVSIFTLLCILLFQSFLCFDLCSSMFFSYYLVNLWL